MIYAILCYSLILTAAVVWLFRSERKLKAEMDAKAGMFELDIAGLEVAVKDASGEIQRLETMTNGLAEDIADIQATEQFLDECCEKLDGRCKAIEEHLGKLQTEFEEVVADEVSERARGEKLFNEGLTSIMNYGGEIPTLNKEDMRNGE